MKTKVQTWFVTSDIHGFYHEFIDALKQAGYDKKDPTMGLIVCGDIADRGPDAPAVYRFLRSIPKSRRILIRGNHELLLRKAINRGVFYQHDYHNGTLGTIMQFTGASWDDCVDHPQMVCDQFKQNGVLDWIFGPEWCNYCELGNYIFVHSWIPVNIQDDTPVYDVRNTTPVTLRPDWREATTQDWEEATWGCPWLMAKKGLVPSGYTIVCGHWHSYDFPKCLDNDLTDYPNYNIYKGHNCIALDACTVISRQCNVLVLTTDDLKSVKGSK